MTLEELAVMDAERAADVLGSTTKTLQAFETLLRKGQLQISPDASPELIAAILGIDESELGLEKPEVVKRFINGAGERVSEIEGYTYDVTTSITLDYRAMSWRAERIVLDSVSNHIDGGKPCAMFRQEGKLIDFRKYDPTKEVEEIVLGDDGKGYTTKKLHTLRSTKTASQLTIGQFGEGLKLVAASALRHNLDLEYRSRNWVAAPYAQAEEDDGDKYELLGFRNTQNGLHQEGSQTIIRKPSKELIDEVLQLPNKVLHFNENYRELHNEKDNVQDLLDKFAAPSPIVDYGKQFLDKSGSISMDKIDTSEIDERLAELKAKFPFNPGGLTRKSPQLTDYWVPKECQKNPYYSRIVDTGVEGELRTIFVKGIKVQGIGALFDYDLGMDLPPDRNSVDDKEVLDEIEAMLKKCANTDVIKAVLSEAHDNPESYQAEIRAFNPQRHLPADLQKESNHTRVLNALNSNKDPDNLWYQTFKEMYDEEAEDGTLKETVIASDDTFQNNDALALGYKVIKMNKHVGDYLNSLGIKSADQVAKGIGQHCIWVDQQDYNEREREILANLSDVTRIILGEERDVDVRIFSGKFTDTGREIEASEAVWRREEDGTEYIGIKRKFFEEGMDAVLGRYVHELAHYETKAPDGDRDHADWGFDKAAELAMRLYERK